MSSSTRLQPRPAVSEPLRVMLVDRDLAELGLVGWWNGLASVRRNVMLRWEYLDAWRDAFMPADARPRTAVVARGDQPVAALPLYRWHGTLHGWSSAEHSDVIDVGAADEDAAAIAALAHRLARHRTDLDRLDGTSPLLAALRDVGPPMIVDPDVSPVVALPDSEAAMMAQLSAKFRANVRRAERRLATLGEPTVVEHRGDEPGARAALDRLVALEATGWKGVQGSAIASRPDTQRFHRQIATGGPLRRWAQIVELRLGDRVVAAQLDLEHGGRRHGLKMACATDLPPNHSPGTVLLCAVLRGCIARGVTTVELGGELDGWKRHWATGTVDRPRVRTWPDTPAGRVAFGARERLKPVVRPLIQHVGGGS